MIKKTLKKIQNKKNYYYVLIGLLFSAIFAFSNNLILAKILSPQNYGLFFSILAIAMLFGNLSVSGIPLYLQNLISKKNISKTKPNEGDIILLIICFFTILFLLFYFLWIFLGPNDLSSHTIFIILSILIIFQPFIELSKSILQINLKFKKLSYLNIIINFNRFLLLALLIFFLKKNINLNIISIIFILGSLPGFIYSIIIFKSFFRFNLINFFTKNIYYKTIKILFDLRFYFITNVFYFIFISIDIIIIKYFLSDFDAGIFFAAFSIVLGLQLLSEATVRTYSFQYFKKSRKKKYEFKIFYKKNIKFLMYLTLPVSLSIFLLSEQIITILYSTDYYKSSQILKILIFIVPIKLIVTNLSLVAITFKKSIYNTLSLVLVTIIKIPLLITFIYYFNLLGAVLCLILIEILYYLILKYFVEYRIFNEK